MARTRTKWAALRALNLRPGQLRAKATARVLKVWAKCVIAQGGGKCAWCDSTRKVQAHHIVARSRANHLGWFDLQNGMPLCTRCHLYRLKANPDAYITIRDKWLREQNRQAYSRLEVIYATAAHIDDATIILIEHALTLRLTEIRPTKGVEPLETG